MDKALGWLGDIFQALLKIFPVLVVVPATHAGVVFSRGRNVRVWDPGLHVYWPLVSIYKVMTTVRQTQMLQSKVVMTKDLKTVIVGALVTYFVDDIMTALAKIADLPSDIIERSTEGILEEVSKHTLEEIQVDRTKFNERMTERVSKSLNGYGVHVLQTQLTEFAPCRAVAITGHAAVGSYALWTGF
ncbi:MAG: SPFH domain-containing protein [Planctomycetes bacterium]|nr:SPFH domain-containing protein [Planctomycetota bacterium]